MPQQYDVTAKLLLGRPRSALFGVLFGESKLARWRNVELPAVENPRSDLMAETEDGVMHYMEIDSGNDARMLPRVVRKYWRAKEAFPDQRVRPVVLYIGRTPLQLPCPFEDEYSPFLYHLVDMRDQNGDALLASSDIEDNMLAVLTQADKERVFTVVLRKLRALPELDRGDHATRFVILCGLRNLEDEIIEKVRTMVTLDDLLANKVFGPVLAPMLQQHLDKGRAEGRDEGRQQGHLAGERDSLRILIHERFGEVPAWAASHIESASEADLRGWLKRILTAQSLDELFETRLH